MLKLFQFTVWVFVSWQTVLVQMDDGPGVDLLAAFILGGMCAYWATGFLVLFRILASRTMTLARRALRRLFLFHQPHQPAHRYITQERRRT